MNYEDDPVYAVADKVEKRLMRAGMPSRYVKYDKEDIRGYHTLSFDVRQRDWIPSDQPTTINATRQRKKVNEILSEPDMLRYMAPVVGVGSYPTDHLGMIFANAVCKYAISLGINPLVINAWQSPRAFEEKSHEKPRLVVIHNVRADATSSRMDMCRDWLMLTAMDRAFRILVVAGTDPITFFDRHIGFKPDLSLNFRGE
jgi:hypothetical protein